MIEDTNRHTTGRLTRAYVRHDSASQTGWRVYDHRGHTAGWVTMVYGQFMGTWAGSVAAEERLRGALVDAIDDVDRGARGAVDV